MSRQSVVKRIYELGFENDLHYYTEVIGFSEQDTVEYEFKMTQLQNQENKQMCLQKFDEFIKELAAEARKAGSIEFAKACTRP